LRDESSCAKRKSRDVWGKEGLRPRREEEGRTEKWRESVCVSERERVREEKADGHQKIERKRRQTGRKWATTNKRKPRRNKAGLDWCGHKFGAKYGLCSNLEYEREGKEALRRLP
jgi:hypothetical protein